MVSAEASVRPLRITILALLGLAAVLALYPLIRSFWDFEIDFNEGWNGYFQLRAMAGEPLYTGFPPYFANNYPPLSFYLVGALGQVTGDPVLAGRLISLAALGAIAWASGSIVGTAGGGRRERLFTVATCVLLFTAFATDYLGMNDPQLLAQAFATAALAVHLGGLPSARRTVLTALLVTVSVMTKHNLILVPLLITGDVLFRGAVGYITMPGGSLAQLLGSVTDTLLPLPPDTLVYPGHGPLTTIGVEQKTNSWMPKPC